MLNIKTLQTSLLITLEVDNKIKLTNQTINIIKPYKDRSIA